MMGAETVNEGALRQVEPLWAELLEDVRDGLDQNRVRAGECALNRVNLSGECGVAWSQSKGLLRTAKRQEPEDDRLRQHYRWLKRKLFKTKPQLTAHPGGLELVDAKRANVAERVFDFWRVNNGWLEAEEECYRWEFPTGRAYMEVCWEKGTMPLQRKGLRLLDEAVERVVDGRRVRSFVDEAEGDEVEGDIGFRVLYPNGVFLFPLSAPTWRAVERIVSIDLVTRGYLEEQLGEAVETGGMVPWKAGQVDYREMDALMELTGGEWAEKPRRGDELFLLVQSRERPNHRRLRGRLLVACGGVVLRDEELPYVDEAREIDPTNAFNLAMGVIPWFAERVVGSLLPPAPATILRGKQRQILEYMRLIQQNRYAVGLNKVFAQEGTFERQKWTDENGQILTYNNSSSRNPPTMIQGQPLLGAEQEKAALERSFDESAGRPTVLRGDNPPQVRGAFHLQILYEEASEILALEINAREKFAEQVGRLALAVWRRRASREQVLRIYGRERASHVWAWMGLDIAADLRVVEGSAMPRNHSAIVAQLVELLHYGAFTKDDGKPDYQAFWSMLELGVVNRAVQAKHMHRLQAENNFSEMLYGGKLVYPEAEEEHAIHIEVFRELMASPEYTRAEDGVKAVLKGHLQLRTEMFAEQAVGGAGIMGGGAPGDLGKGFAALNEARAGIGAPDAGMGAPGAAGGQVAA